MAKNLTTEKKLEIINEISALADGVTLEYVKGLSEIVCSPDTEPDEKRKAYAEMDKVLRISKQYSDRVLLAGEMTERRTKIKLRSEAKDALAAWHADSRDSDIVLGLDDKTVTVDDVFIGNVTTDDGGRMSMHLLRRHGSHINVGFADGHQEIVELGALWSLKWYNDFQTQAWVTRDDGSPIYRKN